MKCCVCDADAWLPIPDPVPDRSITTAGILLNEPLAKAQCQKCGLLQRVDSNFVGDSDFYEHKYADYYRRAGVERYDAPRYAAMADWMYTQVSHLDPKSILDVGCGAGWSMLAAKKMFPEAKIEGVEPSTTNAELAREAGFNVHASKIGAGDRPSRTYDLIYAINVFQHVLAPDNFLTELRHCLSEQGLLVLICPDASSPSHEMLWCDHNFSFQPKHLAKLAERAGFRVAAWQANPNEARLLDKQLIVLSKRAGPSVEVGRPGHSQAGSEELFCQRRDYINSWHNVRRHLNENSQRVSRVYNFGASMWSWLLAAYCPEYWHSVVCCLVDDFSGTCVDKEVKPIAEISLSGHDCLGLGVNPASQPALVQRFFTTQFKTIAWDHYMRG